MLPENGFLIMPHFLALALTGLLLIFIVRDSEVRALQRAGYTNDVFVGGEPVGAQIERDIASVVIKVSRIDRIEKAIGVMRRAREKQSPISRTRSQGCRYIS